MIILWVMLAISFGFIAGWFLRQFLGQKKLARTSEYAAKLIDEAKIESENLKREKLLEAKEINFQIKQKTEQELKNKQREAQRLEKQLTNRELNLDRKVDILNKKENDLNQLNKNLNISKEKLRNEELKLEQLLEKENQRLEQISGLTTEEAKRVQMQNILEKAKKETALEVREIQEEAKQKAVQEAREIILEAVQRSAVNHIVDTTISIINLPDDEMKGRIIGREGRNIRAFESATGIEVLIDDTPQTVVLSGFDPLRREIARLALEKLLYDGRIHPGRIEEVVIKTREEIDEKIFELGEAAIHEVGLHGIHSELIRLLGRQKFRTTYGQNLLQHSKEVARLSGQMAGQLGLDITLAKRAGLLHDIGKVAEEYGDGHVHEIGAELAKKFGENEVVHNVILTQSSHNNPEIISPITILVQMANSISVSRPGAQKEMLETFIKRLSSMEQIALSFSGVENAYAIQGGKELRVIVEHSIVDDANAQILADNIAERLKEETEFPGQIRITVIREYRAVEFAK
ncbi:MAG: ribonuclease Y [Caldithrix sp.]|nr:MAG: ribonuclease Y [Caldithrix sp.]